MGYILKIIINGLSYKSNSSGIGVLIRELFVRVSQYLDTENLFFVCEDSPELDISNNLTIIHRIPYKNKNGIRRIFYQTFLLSKYCENSVLLTTDSKVPFFLPKSCKLIPVITDLALYSQKDYYKVSRVLLWKLQYMYMKKKACRYIAISEYTKRDIIKYLGVDEDKIDVISCGISNHFIESGEIIKKTACMEEYNIDYPYLLFVGNFNPRKNLKRIIVAFDNVKKKYGIPHKLIISGEYGWKFNKNEIIKNIKFINDIVFLGFVRDEYLSQLYKGADIFLFPTLYEGFGVPVIEAQYCKTAVITSNISALPEIGGCGALYVNPYNLDEIEDAIVDILNSNVLKEKLITNGNINIRRFSWEESAKRINDIIKENLY